MFSGQLTTPDRFSYHTGSDRHGIESRRLMYTRASAPRHCFAHTLLCTQCQSQALTRKRATQIIFDMERVENQHITNCCSRWDSWTVDHRVVCDIHSAIGTNGRTSFEG